MSFRALRIAALACSVAGCGPIEYLVHVPFDASGAIAEARQAGAEQAAPYEMTAAGEYLHKARELAGAARFQGAVEFGRKAAQLARDARRITYQKARLRAEDGAAAKPSPPAPGSRP